MLPPRVRDTLLTLFGIMALIVYVLACRPSFSPDGTKVVLPIMDAKTKVTSVVLYDLKKKSMETIFVSAPALTDENRAYSAQWLPDGKRVVVNGVSTIMILPLGSSNPTRFLPLEERVEGNSLELPAPVVGKYQFLLGKTSVQEKNEKGATVSVDKSALLQVNLETLDVKSAPIGFEGNLVGNGGQLFYIGKPENGDEGSYELGRLDTEKLTKIPLLQVKEKDSGEPTGFVTPNKNGSRFALMTKLEDAQRVLLVRGNVVEKTISVAARDSGIRLGNAEWSPDEKTLYLAYTKKVNEEELGQFGVLEVPLAGGRVRETPLFTAKPDKDNSLILFQIALSSDGRQIAATSACLGEENGVKAEERALYLVDLSNAKRKVTKVALPLPPVSGSAAEKK